jgi:hypothetical protein
MQDKARAHVELLPVNERRYTESPASSVLFVLPQLSKSPHILSPDNSSAQETKQWAQSESSELPPQHSAWGDSWTEVLIQDVCAYDAVASSSSKWD